MTTDVNQLNLRTETFWELTVDGFIRGTRRFYEPLINLRAWISELKSQRHVQAQFEEKLEVNIQEMSREIARSHHALEELRASIEADKRDRTSDAFIGQIIKLMNSSAQLQKEQVQIRSQLESISIPNRDQLLLEHLPTVCYQAHRIHERLTQHVELDDLISAGVGGLIDAFSKFDHTKQVPFKSYAQFRIRGAILDSIRTVDKGPRELRRWGRAVEDAIRSVTHKLGSVPTEHEFPRVMKQKLREVIEELPEKERIVVMLYYNEELTMKEIGLILDVDESRVSQIRSSAVVRLRHALAGMRRDPEPTSKAESTFDARLWEQIQGELEK
jgi:RNA polymerase sigma factor for flagellar operon FliA